MKPYVAEFKDSRQSDFPWKIHLQITAMYDDSDTFISPLITRWYKNFNKIEII